MEEEQLTIEAHARNTDPWTSHAAAESLPSERIRASQEAVYDCFVYMNRPVEFDELILGYRQLRGAFDWPQQSPSGLRTRTNELVRMGKLRNSGESIIKPSGRRAILWELNQ